MENLRFWNQVKTPSPEAIRQITGGRLNGKHDINPQWRYKVMTDVFGPCGIGWKFEILRLWTELAGEKEMFAWAQVNVYFKDGDTWSQPIPGIGGNMLLEMEKGGLHANDEAYKMAITDALGTALKMIGVGADVYFGIFDGKNQQNRQSQPSISPPATNPVPGKLPGSNQWIIDMAKKAEINVPEFLKWMNNSLHLPVEDTIEKTMQTLTDKNQIKDEERQVIAMVLNKKLEGCNGKSK